MTDELKKAIDQKLLHLSNLATSNIKHIFDAYTQVSNLDKESSNYALEIKTVLDNLESTSTYWLKEDEKVFVDQAKHILSRIILFLSMEVTNDQA